MEFHLLGRKIFLTEKADLSFKALKLFTALSVLALLTLISPAPSYAQTPKVSIDMQGFEKWKNDFRQEALRRGIKANILDQALTGVVPSTRVIELDRNQPESKWTFAQYLEKVVNTTRIKKGRERYQKHLPLLKEIGEKFGVQPRFIVALWGIETNFGSHTGGFSVVKALATLAYDGRRSEYFRKELFNAMTILNEGHIAPAQMKGSWAGAMGQCQFMPSSFLRYAVDYDGDGHKDIWNTRKDVFASIANYLGSVGWNATQTWGRKITLPRGFKMSLANHKKIWKTLEEWDRLGLKNPDGSGIPIIPNMKAAVIAPDGRNGPTFLVYENFNHTMKWNRSTYFATAVGLLADKIAGR